MAEAPWSLLIVKLAATGDVIVGAAGIAVVILGADVPDGRLSRSAPSSQRPSPAFLGGRW